MPVAQSPAQYINSSKGCPFITESFPLVVFLVLCATVAALPVVQPHLGFLDVLQFIFFRKKLETLLPVLSEERDAAGNLLSAAQDEE
jgi:hypothetical protein